MPLDLLGLLLIVAAIVLPGRLTGKGIASIDPANGLRAYPVNPSGVSETLPKWHLKGLSG